MPTSRTIAHRVLQHCHDRGVRMAFGVHGANIEDFYAAAPDAGITAIVAKHEFAAGVMADGLSRLSDSPALVLTTSGGGAMNVLPALAESYDSRVPVLAVIGSAPTNLIGHGGFQDMLSPPDTIDLLGLLAGVTGYCAVLDGPDCLESTLTDAFAALDRGLPAAIVVPKDVQAQQVHDHPADYAEPANPTVATVLTPALEVLADRLVAARVDGVRVCIWVGHEAARRRVGPLVERLASRLAADIVAAPEGLDVVAASHTSGVTGVMGHPSARRAIADAGLCLAVGCRMTVTDRAGLDDALAGAEVIYLGSHSPRRRDCTAVIVDDLSSALELLDDRLARCGLDQAARSAPERELLAPPPVAGSTMLTLRQIAEAIDDELPATAKVFVDAGNVGAAAVHYLRPVETQRITVALGMGGMGYAIAAGVGVAVAAGSSGDRAVVIAGDGAFYMHGMEFHTAVQYHAPLTLVVLNNNAHGMCVTRETLYFPGAASVNRFAPTDIAGGLAALFDGTAVHHPTTRDELRAACAAAFADPAPNCIVVDCHPDEIPPFAPFL